MNMNKKGAGIIIAWVLLVGLGVTLGIFVTTWMAKQAEERTESMVSYLTGDIKCRDIAINVKTDSCSPLVINVTNKGLLRVEQYAVRVRNDTAMMGKKIVTNLTMPEETKQLYIGSYSNINKIEVIPLIKVSDDPVEIIGCSDRKLIIDSSC